MDKVYTLVINRSASKEIRNLSASARQRVLAAIEALAYDPRPRGCKKLRGTENDYRVRIGNYRVIYQIQDQVVTVIVLKVGHRRDIYESH